MTMQADGQSGTADLAGLPWTRGIHELTVEVRTRPPDERSFQKTQKVDYVPKPPRIHPRNPRDVTKAVEVQIPEFHFEADVEPTPGEKARARLICRNGDKVLREVPYGPSDAGLHIDEILRLEPGPNTIELEAVNEGARDGSREEETERLGPLTVYFTPPRPAEKPIIQLDSLVLVENGARAGRIPITGTTASRPVETTPRVLVLGRITAKDKDPLTRVERSTGGKQGWQALAGSEAGLQQTFEIQERIDLVPNRQTISFRARIGDLESIVPLNIDYHPVLPTLEGLAVDPARRIIPGVEKGESNPAWLAVGLAASIEGATEGMDPPIVLLDGQRLTEPLSIDRQIKKLSGTIRVLHGPNPHQVSVQLSNRWHSATFGPIPVEYRRPPKIEDLHARVLADRSFARLSAMITSLTALTGAEIKVVHLSGIAPADRTFDARPVQQNGGTVWTLDAEVPLQQGTNELILRTWNEDGASPEKRVELVYEKPVEPPPDVRLGETPERATSDRPFALLRFQVGSKSPLKRVELFREGNPKPVESFPVGPLAQGSDGTFEFSQNIALEPRENKFQLIAENAGGVSWTPLVFTYIEPSLRVVIDQVESGDRVTKYRPQGRVNGPPFIPEPFPESAIVLTGRVVGTKADSLELERDPPLQVWINGFPHVAVPLGPALQAEGPRKECPFEAKLLLSQLENNEIELRLNGQPLDNLGDLKLLVSCQKVVKKWQLHLLVIGVGAVDRQELLERAIAALKGREFKRDADRWDTGTFTTPAFETATLYGFWPEDRDVEGPSVNGKLRKIHRAITMRTLRPSNDVVVLYYQGGEVIAGQEPCLRLRPTGMDSNAIIPLREIRKRLGETRGAKLLLLDVTHAKGQQPSLARGAQWTEDTFGFLRFVWQGQPGASGTRLAATLRAALEDKITLAEVSAEIERRVRQVPNLRYDKDFAPYFNHLELGGR
jgi:hypothetical protein